MDEVGSPAVPLTSAQIVHAVPEEDSHTLDDKESSEELSEVVDKHDTDKMMLCRDVCGCDNVVV